MEFVSDHLLEVLEGHGVSNPRQYLDSFAKYVVDIDEAEEATAQARVQDNLSGLHSFIGDNPTVNAVGIDQKITEVQDAQRIPEATIDKLTESGFTAASFPERLGGHNLPYQVFVAHLETLAQASPSVATGFAISNTCAQGLMFDHRDKKLSDYNRGVLTDIIAGKRVAFCLTEENGGSDAFGNMQTKLELSDDGESVRINGTKIFITNGDKDVRFVMAKNPEDGQVSIVIADGKTGGNITYSEIRKETIENSPFYEVRFENVVAPIDHVVGGLGNGREYAKMMLNSGRVTIAAIGLGIAQRALDEYEALAEETLIRGKKLNEYEAHIRKISSLSSSIRTARLLTYKAAILKDQAYNNPTDKMKQYEFALVAAQAKLQGTDVCENAAKAFYDAGGASSTVLEHYLPAKLQRDTRLVRIGEGVPEVLSETIQLMMSKTS